MEHRDFAFRIGKALMEPTIVGKDGITRPSPEFEAAEREIAALQESGPVEVDAEVRELADRFRLLRDILTGVISPDEAIRRAKEHHGTPSFREPEPPIFDAIEDGDIEAVRAALRDCDVNLRHGEFLQTPLYKAMSCMLGASIEVIELLLDAGADPRKGLTQTNVLHGLGFANWRGVRPEELARVIARCVALGADLEERSDKLGWTPLILAVSERNPMATEALLMAGADIRVRAAEVLVEGVCFSGADVIRIANGHGATLAVLQRYATEN